MKVIKAEYRATLSDYHLDQFLRLADYFPHYKCKCV